MPFHFQGKTFEAIPNTKMTPGEIDAVERITGLTYQKLTRLSQTCVCDHGLNGHVHRDAEGVINDDDHCEACDCVQFVPDLPTKVHYAYLWVALKREDPTATFADIESVPQDEWTYERSSGATENPTEPSPAE